MLESRIGEAIAEREQGLGAIVFISAIADENTFFVYHAISSLCRIVVVTNSRSLAFAFRLLMYLGKGVFRKNDIVDLAKADPSF
jgi:hypothetical protein